MENRYPNNLTGEELIMALIFSKDRKMFIPQVTGKLLYLFLIGSAKAGVGLQKATGEAARGLTRL